MLDLNKPVQTRDGRPARIYATDGNNQTPIHGAVLIDGEWYIQSWTSTGELPGGLQHGIMSNLSLINVPEKKSLKGTIVLESDGSGLFFPDRGTANASSAPCNRYRVHVRVDGEFPISKGNTNGRTVSKDDLWDSFVV